MSGREGNGKGRYTHPKMKPPMLAIIASIIAVPPMGTPCLDGMDGVLVGCMGWVGVYDARVEQRHFRVALVVAVVVVVVIVVLLVVVVIILVV